MAVNLDKTSPEQHCQIRETATSHPSPLGGPSPPSSPHEKEKKRTCAISPNYPQSSMRDDVFLPTYPLPHIVVHRNELPWVPAPPHHTAPHTPLFLRPTTRDTTPNSRHKYHHLSPSYHHGTAARCLHIAPPLLAPPSSVRDATCLPKAESIVRGLVRRSRTAAPTTRHPTSRQPPLLRVCPSPCQLLKRENPALTPPLSLFSFRRSKQSGRHRRRSARCRVKRDK